MKTLSLEQWDEKYITGDIERFDQKNTMFMRVLWDPSIKDAVEDWSFSSTPKDKAGHTLQDLSLKWAARYGVNMGLFNTSKPYVAPLNQAISEVVQDPKFGARFIQYRPADDDKPGSIDPQTISRDIKKAARFFGADLVGICKLDRRWVYSHLFAGGPNELPEEYQYAVVMGFAEEYNMLKYFPSYIADAATSMGYSRMAIANAYLAEFLRGMGFKAIDCTTNDVALSIPMAMQAGFGELGRNGLLITPEFGPRIRVSKVITNVPLIADGPIEFGVTEFCNVCKKCAAQCPSQAIIFGDRITEPHNVSNAAGELKWPINAEKCRMYWGKMNKPCTNCVSVCPFNKHDNWFHSTVRWFVDHVRWADSFYMKMDTLLGYGKPKKANRFWEEWQPE